MRNKRLMPTGHWDWPIPVSISQVWLVDNLLFIGSQVSANADGQIVAPSKSNSGSVHSVSGPKQY